MLVSPRLHFYQTRSVWSVDQGSTRKRSAVHNFVPTVTKFCVMWAGLSLPHDTKYGNCMSDIIDRRVIINWSLIHRSSWSGLIKVGPGHVVDCSASQTYLTNNCTLPHAAENIELCRWMYGMTIYPAGTHLIHKTSSRQRFQDVQNINSEDVHKA